MKKGKTQYICHAKKRSTPTHQPKKKEPSTEKDERKTVYGSCVKRKNVQENLHKSDNFIAVRDAKSSSNKGDLGEEVHQKGVYGPGLCNPPISPSCMGWVRLRVILWVKPEGTRA